MVSRREKFSSQPEELPLGIEQDTPSRPVIDMDKFRAFGSIPRLLGSEISTLTFEQLDRRAWERTEPSVIEQGLFGREGGTAVNGLVLGSELYEAIIRNQDSFLASIAATTTKANRQTPDPRAQEKNYHSQIASLVNKQSRHENIIADLERRQEILLTFQDMQRTPGYHKRISELELRVMATTVWESVFVGMLRALKDQYDLSNNEIIEMEQALSYRLLKADKAGKNSQNERMANWGKMLRLGNRYTGAAKSLFTRSKTLVERGREGLEDELAEFYHVHQISPLGKHAVRHTVEQF